MQKQIALMIGTRKGAFLAFSDAGRRQWELKGPYFKGIEINHVGYLPRAQVVTATFKSAWWGPGIQLSRDWGANWEELKPGIRFAEGRGRSVERLWIVKEDPATGAWFAGLDPGSLFRSDDAGATWREVTGLNDHPTRDKWMPGAGGLMVHRICFDPTNARRMYVAISAAGTFRSDDGGETWDPKNSGVRADFLPNTLPEVGQCVHSLDLHGQQPSVLYQQNHCGVYRSDDAGDAWTDLSDGLPSRFGFALAVHPHDGDTVYVVPEEADVARVTPGGAFRVFRSRNRGASWQPLTNGLPQANAFQNVLRGAMTTDSEPEPAVYVGTQGGHVLVGHEGGDRWEVALNWLPPVYSLAAATITD
jgi:photosystem II stability/assembly factor-like uncharacterized protein